MSNLEVSFSQFLFDCKSASLKPSSVTCAVVDASNLDSLSSFCEEKMVQNVVDFGRVSVSKVHFFHAPKYIQTQTDSLMCANIKQFLLWAKKIQSNLQ